MKREQESRSLKGFSWFITVDQVVQILQGGQAVRVFPVKAHKTSVRRRGDDLSQV
jgi:hypothetical protein